MSKFGIDISNHNGDINWSLLSKEISFVMIRAGYGTNEIDARAETNVTNAEKYGVPYGLYWFSYALTKDKAIAEANSLCDFADKHSPTFPLCFDWEYDSDNYASKNKVDTSSRAMVEKAIAFLDRVKERGYYPMLYTNRDYLTKGFGALTDRYDIWLAEWSANAPSISCGIWQSTSRGTVKGINGHVDKDVSYKDYPAIIAGNKNSYELTENLKEKITSNVTNYFWSSYTKLANDIIKGKYGNGIERRAKVESMGYDYEVAQIFVNAFLGF